MGKRILLVEDEEDNLTLLIHILKYLLGQEQLHIARDGHEAMTLAYQQRPDLILMDLSLPKLDGWETVRSLRADEMFRSTPIIALTAHAMAGDKDRALTIGCNDYFAKPIDLDVFLLFIKPYLEDRSADSQTQQSAAGMQPSVEKGVQAPPAASQTPPGAEGPAAPAHEPAATPVAKTPPLEQDHAEDDHPEHHVSVTGGAPKPD